MARRSILLQGQIIGFALLYAIALIKISTAIDYKGYKVYAVSPMTARQEKALNRMIQEHGDKIDVWTRNRLDGVHVMVAPDMQDYFEQFVLENDIKTRIVIEDVSNLTARRRNESLGFRRSFHYDEDTFNFDRFPRYAEIVHFMRQLSNTSKYASVISIGNSYEGRALIGMRIKVDSDNPAIFVDAGIHAREWAAPVAALYIMKKIIDLEDYFAKKLSIYIIPTANPDGYEYTHTTDRFWRKTRSSNPASTCKGVDANRNFDSHWGEVGVSSDPCSGSYAGPEPFSEAETKAIRDALHEIKPILYLTLHSFGSLFLYPWGFTPLLPPNWKELDELARLATAKLYAVNGEVYTVGSSTNTLYPASGGSDDYAMQKVGVPLVYTMELPDYGQGFEVPTRMIKPMVTETFEAFKVLAQYVFNNFKV